MDGEEPARTAATGPTGSGDPSTTYHPGAPHLSRSAWPEWTVAGVVVAVGAVVVTSVLSDDRAVEPIVSNPPASAVGFCRDVVGDELKALGTAVFGDAEAVPVNALDGTYRVTGSVTSDNINGARTRSTFTCTVDLNDARTGWHLISVSSLD